ncbi:MAG: cyclic nucleotide-binding domain-containing protein [Chloroflexi bacterium]|nr:cyclic nucleotide-binding domain-containing protein [Chloroflexota bacterium]MBI3170746.1 cyclic nucleotide-binding domain-containing protein [Chloroflexota bacterium]
MLAMLESLPVIPLFKDLNTQQSSVLMQAFETFDCPPGTVIFEQGDLAKYLYLILKGKAIISYKPYDAPRITITRLKDGDVFGWSAVVGGKKYSFSVASETDLETIRIHRDLLLKILSQHPDTGEIIIDRLALNVSPRWENAHEQIKAMIKSERS